MYRRVRRAMIDIYSVTKSKTLRRILLALGVLAILGMMFSNKEAVFRRLPLESTRASVSMEDVSLEDYTNPDLKKLIRKHNQPFPHFNLTSKDSNVTTKTEAITIAAKLLPKPMLTTKLSKVSLKPEVTPEAVKLMAKEPVNVISKTSINVTSKPEISRRSVNATSKSIVNAHPSIVTEALLKASTNTSKERLKTLSVAVNPLKVAQFLAGANSNDTRLSSGLSMKTVNMTEKSKPPAKSTEPPLDLGDTYGMDDTYLHSSCPTRARDKLLTEEFKNIFVESIPVFQWKKHATESEYKRLRKYWGIYGWGGVTWDVLNETLNLLNGSNNGYLFNNWKGKRPCIRCAVMGNAGIMNGSGMGKEIDAHDYVFRVNGAITKGFEKDVGNRTSFFFFSTNTLMNSLLAYGGRGFKSVPRTEETRYLLLPDHDRDYLLVRAALSNRIIDRGRDKKRDPARYFGKNLTTEHFKILHPDFGRYLRNRFLWSPILKTKHSGIYRPSTGASMLLAAVHACDEVNAYGYMTPNYSKFSDHYFDATYHRVVFYLNHSFLKEMELWQKLHKAGVIKLYMRD
uniref:alpha-N-acetylgalactosaminide alpha-2,6-sialyltransferase n=1 Tax=Leptobrachium leishanense TaxID=445787 RepID=A0A8C5R784_9ANUR